MMIMRKEFLDKNLIRTGEEDKDFIYVEPNTAIEIAFRKNICERIEISKSIEIQTRQKSREMCDAHFQKFKSIKSFSKAKTKGKEK